LNRTRALVAFALALGAALLIAACGGGGGNDEDPQQVLNETFQNDQSIDSGTFDLDLKVDASGGDNAGSLEAKIGGPFQGRQGQFPQFDVDVSLKAKGGSQNLSGSGGVTSTGQAAFVNFQGADYAVPQEVFDQFASTFTQLQSQTNSQGQGGNLLQSLGIDPAGWLTDLSNDGTEDVEGSNTIHISGKADVPKLVADLKTIVQKTGGATGKVSPDQLDQLTDIIKSADFDIFSGETDKLLRRLGAKIELTPPAGAPGAPDSVTLEFELTFADVNQPQTVNAPDNPRPLSQLLQQLGLSPSALGGALRGGLGSSGALPETGGSTTAPSNSSSQAYLQCLSQAEGQSALQECAKLLGR
jgi:hypothetical protein